MNSTTRGPAEKSVLSRYGTIHVAPTDTEFARFAMETFLSGASRAIRERGQGTVAISGGETPKEFYRLLGQEASQQLDWSAIHIFWADERCIPLDSPDNQWKMATDLWLHHVPIPPANIHRMRVEQGPAQAAAEYEQELHRFFGAANPPVFDLVFLGLGEDGHTASLYPGAEGTCEREEFVTSHYVPQRKQWRVTLTARTLRIARQLIFLVAGKKKSEALESVLTCQHPHWNLPASMVVARHPNVLWITDPWAVSSPGLIPLFEK